MRPVHRLTNKAADRLTAQACSTTVIGVAVWLVPHNRHGMNASCNTTIGDSPRITGGATTRRILDGVVERVVQ